MTMLTLTPFFNAVTRTLATIVFVKLYAAMSISILADWTRLTMACSIPPSGENRAWTGNLLTLAMNSGGLMKLVKCATRTLKKARRFVLKHPIYTATSLFNGQIHFVKIIFPNLTVNDADVQTGIKYATLASKPIQQYCSQYGPNSVTVDPLVYYFTAPNSNFSDANLQAWIEMLSSTFPNSDAIAVLNPPGANNTDAPLS